MSAGWTTFDDLRPGAIFETEDGYRAVKCRPRQVDGAVTIVFMADGTTGSLEEDTRVRPVPMPPIMPCGSDDLNSAPMHTWFGLTYAQYLTIPRSVLESMPTPWQLAFVQCLEELDATYDWLPRTGGRYWVQLRDANGQWVDDPLMEYRRPHYDHIESLRRTA